MEFPKRIYLQNDLGGETTWCENKINDDDIEYVYIIASEFTQMRKEIEWLQKLLAAAKSGLMSYRFGNQSPELAQEILDFLNNEGGE